MSWRHSESSWAASSAHTSHMAFHIRQAAMDNFESRKVEDCFDDSRVYEYRLLQSPIDKAFIESLAVLGRLEYFPKFPRPFFRVRSQDGLQVKGVQDEQTFQVILSGREQRKRKEKFENELREILAEHHRNRDLAQPSLTRPK